MGAVTVTLAVLDNQDTPAPVDGVLLRIFDDSDSYVTEVSTGNVTPGSGEAEVTLDGSADPGTEYIVRLWKAGYAFDGGPTQRIQVLDPVVPPATNTFDFTALLPEEVVSLDPQMCRVTGRLVDDSLRPLRNKRVDFRRTPTRLAAAVSGFVSGLDPQVVRDNVLVAPVAVQTDSDGQIDVELPRGAIFEVKVQGYELPGWGTDGSVRLIEVQIPDQAGISLEDLLFPYVKSVEYLSTSVLVSVGESEEVELSVLGSNGQAVTSAVALYSLLSFELSDESVARISVEDDKLVVVGSSPGTASVSVSRAESTWAARNPSIPELEILSANLTISVSS